MKIAQNIAEQLGQRIRDLRERQGLSQQELAQRAGIAASTLSKIEAGRYTPNLKIVLSLAESLHVPLDTLLRAQQPSLQALLRTVETPANVGALQQWAERCYRYAQVEKLAGVEVTPAPAYPSPRRRFRCGNAAKAFGTDTGLSANRATLRPSPYGVSTVRREHFWRLCC